MSAPAMPRLPPWASALPLTSPVIVRSGGSNGFARLSGSEVSVASPAHGPAWDQAALAHNRAPLGGAAAAAATAAVLPPAPPLLPPVCAPGGAPPTATQHRLRSCTALAPACS